MLDDTPDPGQLSEVVIPAASNMLVLSLNGEDAAALAAMNDIWRRGEEATLVAVMTWCCAVQHGLCRLAGVDITAVRTGQLRVVLGEHWHPPVRDLTAGEQLAVSFLNAYLGREQHDDDTALLPIYNAVLAAGQAPEFCAALFAVATSVLRDCVRRSDGARWN